MDEPAILLPLTGLLSGFVLGFVARRNFFCTLTSLEQYWYGGNGIGVRTWAFAAIVAVILTQSAIALDWFEPTSSFYLNPNFDFASATIGGLCFGFGMALIGTCGFGALVRLGGGSLKSFVAVLVLGLTALSTQRGLVAFARPDESHFLVFEFDSSNGQSIPNLVSTLAGADVTWIVTILIVVGALAWIFYDPSARKSRSLLTTGLVFGATITAGWLLTSYFSQLSFDPVQIESASFIAPVSDAILQFGVITGIGPDYGVGMIFGTIGGAAAAAYLADDVRWEACDDARELKRHITGAALMGFGGVLALGCTIGQGISAASVLAVSVPVTMISIIIGAKLGLSWLLEGRVLFFHTRG